MKFEELVEAMLIKRYKRFLAEAILENQVHRTIYCPNTGAMTNCDILGSRIWLSHHSNPKRKYAYTWELVEVDGGYLVSINTQHSNILVNEAIKNGIITELQGYQTIRPEPCFGANRFDFLLENEPADDSAKCYVEVKSVTLGDEIHRGFFPDTVTTRGTKQIKSLIEAKQQGHRAVLLYCVQHTGIHRVFPADHIDVEYGEALRQASIAGVEVYAYATNIELTHMEITHPIEVCIPARMLYSGGRTPKKAN